MKELQQEELPLICPHCGEEGSYLIDPSGGEEQTLTTDCETCCKPMVVHVSEDQNGDLALWADRE